MSTIQFEVQRADGQAIRLVVRRPTKMVVERAEGYYRRAYQRAVSAGIPTARKVTPALREEVDAGRQLAVAERTAEMVALQAQLDFTTAACVFHVDGRAVYPSVGSYLQAAEQEDPVAVETSWRMAQLLGFVSAQQPQTVSTS